MRRGRILVEFTPAQEKIVAILEEFPGSSHSDIAIQLKKTRQVIMYHLKFLLEKGFVRRKRSDRKYKYYLTGERIFIDELLECQKRIKREIKRNTKRAEVKKADQYNENRCKIFNYIMEHPGEHYSKIMRALNLRKCSLGYHLKKMVEEGIIVTHSHGIFTFYYPYGAEMEKPLTPMQRKVFNIIKNEPCTSAEIADILERSENSINYHLTNLVKLRVIKRNGDYWYPL